jgi:uncharacterized membrane protein
MNVDFRRIFSHFVATGPFLIAISSSDTWSSNTGFLSMRLVGAIIIGITLEQIYVLLLDISAELKGQRK